MSKPKRPHMHTASRRVELEALASPVRLHIVNIMERKPAWSARQIAGVMGRKPETLYYQLEALEKSGLIVRTGSRSTRRSDETLYSLCAEQIKIDQTRTSPGFLKVLTRSIRSIVRLLDRQLVAALKSKHTRRSGKYRNFRLNQYSLRLSRNELVELHGLLDDVEAFLGRHHATNTGEQYSILIGLTGVHDESPAP